MKYLLTFLSFFLGINLFMYTAASFLASDFNPMNWVLMEYWIGKLIIIFLEIAWFVASAGLAHDIRESIEKTDRVWEN